MAVFTDLSEDDCDRIATTYRLGRLTSVIGIADVTGFHGNATPAASTPSARTAARFLKTTCPRSSTATRSP